MSLSSEHHFALMDIVSKVKSLNLPIGQYIIFGSGPLAVHGIRDARDIDLFVTTDLYKQLEAEGWQEKEWSDGGYYLAKDIFQADDSWHYGDYNPAPEEIIARSEIFDGVPFACLTDVLEWKRAFGRPKDLIDIELIEKYLEAK
jgi:hypothetical protein